MEVTVGMVTISARSVCDRLAACAALLAVLSQHMMCIIAHWRGTGLSALDDLHQAMTLHSASVS